MADGAGPGRAARGGGSPPFEELFQRAGVGLALLGPADEVLWANERWLASTGLSGRDVLGKVFWSLFPATPDPLRALYARARAGEVVTVPPHPQPIGGALRWFEGQLAPLPLGDGVGIVITAIDITERVRSEEQAARDRGVLERLQDVTAALSSALTPAEIAQVVFDKGLELPHADAGTLSLVLEPGVLGMVYLHRAPPGIAESFARFPVDAPLPVSAAVRERRAVWLESPEDIDAHFPAISQVSRQIGHQAMAVLPLLSRQGRPLGALGMAYTRPHRFSDEERGFVRALAEQCAVALDRARLYESERALRAEAERVSEIQQQLMAVVGHDLRTPLTAILLTAESLLRRGSAVDEVALGRIERSADRANRIIGDLLDFARARRGHALAIEPADVDLAELARRVAAEFEVGEEPAAIELSWSGDVTLRADPGRLMQALSNLVGNARQHGAGGPIRVRVTGLDDAVTLEVANGGPPISEELLPRLFEPFLRGAGAPGVRSGSVGLGLYIVAEIVRAHRGTVGVTSTTEHGTTFTVRLPR